MRKTSILRESDDLQWTVKGHARKEKIAPLSILKEAVQGTEEGGGKFVNVRVISAGFGNQRDRHYYPAQTLERAVPIFKGSKVFADHPTKDDERKRPERSIRDWCGQIKETWWDAPSQSIMGKMQVYQGWLWELVKEAGTEVALSINATADIKEGTAEGKPARIVESITSAFSVDVVTFAGARGGVVSLLESDAYQFSPDEQREVDKAMFEGLTVEQLREARPDIVDALRATQTPAPAAPQGITQDQLKEAIAAAVKQTEATYEGKLTEAVTLVRNLGTKVNVSETKEAVATVLGDAKLPDAAKARVLKQFQGRTMGFEGADFADTDKLTEAIGAAVKEEEDYIKSITTATTPPTKTIWGMGGSTATAPAQTDAAKRIQESVASFDKALESFGPLAKAKGPTTSTSTSTPAVDSAKLVDELSKMLAGGK